jgi:hypothetical protein
VNEILNISCGRKRIDGAVNLDISAGVGADVVHDLNASVMLRRYFREVWRTTSSTPARIVPVMEKFTGVPGRARVHITVPHFSSANAFTDPTHRHQFSCFSFDYFGADHALSFYSRARFTRWPAQIVFYPTLVNKLVHRLANRRPEAYERRWAWMFPAWFLSIDLEARK